MSITHNKSGFTIVEVMIFLAVSGLILASASGLFLGRQRQVQYEQGVRDLDFRIGETINNVVVGQFPQSDIECTNDTLGSNDYLELSPGGGAQGANDACVYIGMAIELDPLDDESIIVTPLVAANPPPGQTKPLTVFDGSDWNSNPDVKITPVMDLQSSYRTSHGLPILGMIDGTSNIVDTVLFLSSLGGGQESSPSLLASGTQSINLYTSPSLAADTRVDIQRIGQNDEVHVCAKHQSRDNIKAAITFGFSRSELTTLVNQDIDGGHPCSALTP